jgi:hypothetical protein
MRQAITVLSRWVKAAESNEDMIARAANYADYCTVLKAIVLLQRIAEKICGRNVGQDIAAK